MGILVGVCIFWTTRDLLLGTERFFLFDSIILTLGLMICYLFSFSADGKDITENRDEEEDHSYEEQRYRSVKIV